MASRAWGGSDAPIKGDAEVLGRLRAFATRFPLAAGESLAEEFAVELEEVRRVTPFDAIPEPGDRGGELRASGKLIGPEITPSGIEVAIAFGGPDVPYAIVQHQAEHYRRDEGQAKYLEQTLEESGPFMGARLLRRLEGKLEGRL